MIEITPQYLAEQGLSPTFPQRFWAKVNKDGPVPEHMPHLGQCWVWTAYLNKWGYGRIYAGYPSTRMILSHNASWILHHGPIPEGKIICHHCDNPACVHPKHIWPGTHAENSHDRDDKGRQVAPKGEAQGQSKLTAQQVLEIRRLYSAGGVSQLKLALIR